MRTFSKITIIGGAGFFGTNLCQALSDRQIAFEIGDVRDVENRRETMSGDVVINLTAVHRDDIRDKSEYTRTNVDGAENVAKV